MNFRKIVWNGSDFDIHDCKYSLKSKLTRDEPIVHCRDCRGVKMDKKKEIKPCPFCGGKVQHHRNSFECAKCGYTIIFDNLKYYQADTFPRRHNLVLEAWNTRAERTCHVVPHGYCIANGEESCCRCWSCSECSYGWHVSDYDRQYRYCPNCGARVVE